MKDFTEIFESNHHFDEYVLGDIHDMLEGILNTASRIIYSEEQKDENFKNYKYCIINGSGNSSIKIPNFLKTKNEIVEKTKKFLWWTTKKWTESVERKSILEIQSPYLMDYEFNLEWLDHIEEILIVVPMNLKYEIDLEENPEVETHTSDKYFSSYDFTKAYGWVSRNTSYLNRDGKLISSVLMLNLTDYFYDMKQHKIVKSKFGITREMTDWDIESTMSHELMHLYDTYKILTSKRGQYVNISTKLGKTRIGYLKLDINDESVKDKQFVELINKIAYKYDDTERNAFNNGLYPNILKFLNDNYKNKILNSTDINELVVEMKRMSEFEYVKKFCETPADVIIDTIGPKNLKILSSFERYSFRPGMSDIAKIHQIQLYYKGKAIKLFKKRKNILAEAIEMHNKDIEKPKVNENYGYPSIMGYNSTNNSSSALNILGYQYQLLPINSYYQQEPNKETVWQYIHQGSKVKAYTLGTDPKLVVGRIAKIEKNEAGEIINVYVIKYDPKNDGNSVVKVNPNRITLNNEYVAKTKF